MLTVDSWIDMIVNFFISPILALCKSAPTVSASSIIGEINNFKEGKFANFWRKALKKVSMLTVDS